MTLIAFLTCFSFLSLVVKRCNSVPPTSPTSWVKYIGGDHWSVGGLEVPNAVIETSDGGFLVTGYTHALPGNTNYNALVAKFSLNGSLIFYRNFGRNFDDLIFDTTEASDGSYVLIGSSSEGDYRALLVKLNPNGIIVDYTFFGGTELDRGNSVIESTENSQKYFVICGYTQSFKNSPTSSRDAFIAKLNSDFSFVWFKYFGSDGQTTATKVIKSNDDTYVVVGEVSRYTGGGPPKMNIFVAKFSLDGTLLWKNSFGGGSGDYGYDILQYDNDTLIVVGSSWSYSVGADDAIVAKIRSDGSGLVWFKVFGSGKWDKGKSITRSATNPENIIVAGDYAGAPNAFVPYLAEMSGETGELVLFKTFGKTYGTIYAQSVIQTTDQSYVMTGYMYTDHIFFLTKVKATDFLATDGLWDCSHSWIVRENDVSELSFRDISNKTHVDLEFSNEIIILETMIPMTATPMPFLENVVDVITDVYSCWFCHEPHCQKCDINDVMSSCSECESEWFSHTTDSPFCHDDCSVFGPYFGNMTDGTCSPCSEGCVKCTSDEVCIKCEAEFVLFDSECILCDPECANCTKDECLLCVSEEYILYEGECVNCSAGCVDCVSSTKCIQCESQFLLVENECILCETGCVNCTKSECLECESEEYTLFGGNCSLICPSGCESCTNSSWCTICSDEQNFLDHACVEDCSSAGAYFHEIVDEISVCSTCSVGCLSCSNLTSCTKCGIENETGSQYYLLTGECLEDCSEGGSYFQVLNAGIGVCIACDEGCSSCTGVNNCLECDSGFVLNGRLCIAVVVDDTESASGQGSVLWILIPILLGSGLMCLVFIVFGIAIVVIISRKKKRKKEKEEKEEKDSPGKPISKEHEPAFSESFKMKTVEVSDGKLIMGDDKKSIELDDIQRVSEVDTPMGSSLKIVLNKGKVVEVELEKGEKAEFFKHRVVKSLNDHNESH